MQAKRITLTAVTEIEGKLVQIIDVEKVFFEISPVNEDVSQQVIEEAQQIDFSKMTVLVADDSMIARKQVKNALQSIGINVELVNDGRSALNWLEAKAAELGDNLTKVVPLLISDIEMPEMDGLYLNCGN